MLSERVCEVCGRRGTHGFSVRQVEQLTLGDGFGVSQGPVAVRCSSREACRQRVRRGGVRRAS